MLTSTPALMLRIDLSTRSSSIGEIPENVIRRYLGGRGLGSYLLYENVPAHVDPLGSENRLFFTAGPLSGTRFYYSSKANLTTKSPLTGIYLYSICSGRLAEEMRKAGLWAIEIAGVATFPTYLIINDQDVDFRDASGIWGLETAAAQSRMLGHTPPDSAAAVGIGPAGEELVPSAALFSGVDQYRCFGRGGAGSVMGSKRLKGFVVMGSGSVEAVHEEKLRSARKGILTKLRTTAREWAATWRRYETAADLETTNELGMIPTRNWQTGQFEAWRAIDKSTTPMGWPTKVRPCGRAARTVPRPAPGMSKSPKAHMQAHVATWSGRQSTRSARNAG